MKKNIFLMAAASAIMLTACTSEDDILQTGQQKQAVAQEVGFDVYTPTATNVTRAGLQGTMTTNRLQRSEAQGGGFGVYAYLVEDAEAASGYGANATAYNPASPGVPNFMVNEKLLWNSTNQGWYYNPLKYWPNETDNDSQETPAYMETKETTGTPTPKHHIDRLTFFAYAPYVTEGKKEVGIIGVTDNAGVLTPKAKLNDPTNAAAGTARAADEPSVAYWASVADPNEAVDLLWGVAPAGGLTYTAVNGTTVNVNEGFPLIDMTKPDVNTNMKFLFQHALARIGVKVVAAIDQVGAGGKLDPNTKITIDEITLTGYFGETGVLNLDNPVENVANWRNLNGVDLADGSNIAALTKKTLTLSVANSTIAEHLRFVGTHATPSKQESAADANDRVGVTTVKQDAIEPATYSASTPWTSGKAYAASTLKYSETTPYYTAKECATPVASAALGAATGKWFTLSQKGVFTEANAAGAAKTYTYPEVLSYYDVTFHQVTAAEVTAGTYATYTAYDLDNTQGTDAAAEDDDDTFTPKADVPAAGDYVITACELKAPYYAANTYYKRDANYFMVVPTNNIVNICKSGDIPGKEKELRTVRVKIKYYITTEDEDLNAERAQTENIIEKDVVFPSLANGKSYNLNLVLGLTSVKMEAEVDDWKVINVQADLPQNTAE